MGDEEHIRINLEAVDIADFFRTNSNVICADTLHILPSEFIGRISYKQADYDFWRIRITLVENDVLLEIFVEDYSL